MGFLRVVANSARCLFLLSVGMILMPNAHAQTADLTGRYQCVQVKVQGKSVACNAAPLIMKNDGRFELRGWEGSYFVRGEWVELSDSMIKARAKIEPGHKIVLQYRGKQGLVEMIYERRVAEMGKTALG